MQIPMLGIVGFKLQTLCNHNKKLDYKLRGGLRPPLFLL